MTQQMPDPGFLADVRRAASVWRGNPVVPLLYLLFAVATAYVALRAPTPPTECVRKLLGRCPLPPDEARATSLRSFATFPITLFYVGLVGTARVWYVRRYRGDSLSLGEVWRLSWRMFWRCVRLGLLFGACTLPLVIYALTHLRDGDFSLLGTVFLTLGIVVLDVLFTFVTPGVALYNASVVQSLKGGVSLLKRSWPQCAAYAVVPPLGLTLAGQVLTKGGGHHPVLAAVTSLVGPLLTLLFAGASTAFMLRRYPVVGYYGSVTTMPDPVPVRT